MVFLVVKKRGMSLIRAYLNEAWANSSIDSLVLYIPKPQPPPFG